MTVVLKLKVQAVNVPHDNDRADHKEKTVWAKAPGIFRLGVHPSDTDGKYA